MVVEGLRAKLLKKLVQVEESFPLARFNPLGAGGMADYFTTAHDAVELATCVSVAIEFELPYLVIGEASSVLFSDQGFSGLVIHNQAKQCIIANDRSQIVVESGLPLRQFITYAAGQGFAGLTEFYQQSGTVGGALYSNTKVQGRSIYSALKGVSMLIPPTKIRTEPSIVRYRGDWLQRNEEMSRLQWMRASNPNLPQPILLNAQFQLTTVRSDEIVRRISREAKKLEETTPTGECFGPLFAPLPGVEVTELLTGAGVTSLRVGSVFPDRYNPNYLRAKRGKVTAQDIVELIERMRERVRAQYVTELETQIELVGAWDGEK